MLARLSMALLWSLHWLPLPVLGRLGAALGAVLYTLAGERRRVGRINLARFMPELTASAREQLLRRHFRAFARGLLESGIAWWASPARLRALTVIEGAQHWQAVAHRRCIFLVPHFVGIDIQGLRLCLDHPLLAIYTRQKNRTFDAFLLGRRSRFSGMHLVSRQQGVRGLLKALKPADDQPAPTLQLSPDMDLGPRESLFAPFFNVPVATVSVLPRLARMLDAVVVPLVVTQLPDYRGYALRFHPAWLDYPSEDIQADVTRMNAFVEQCARAQPECYHWLHKRLKTRPPGEQSPY